ncbi:FIG00003370: Multicopper polyphenol oxidase [hydrothermal vent metagenome]|uniref:FIG00003370: Multicopper polyphenol oxidase n=1 Tax=hydrothermal vent metagenome TaxID=652676 RepID=A0A3B0RIR7_9ZZZZ
MDNDRIINKDGLTFATSPLLGDTSHAFLGRTGGVSRAPFTSLNTGMHVGDNPGDVAKNRRRIRECFGVEDRNLIIVTQVHGTEVINIEKELPPETAEADAIITARSDIAVAVQTADCVPILFFDPDKNIICAAHAGWRGTLGNIAGKTVTAMKKNYGSDPAKIRAAIGPSIGPCCYEVSTELIGRFHDTLNHAGQASKERHLDLPGINKVQLEEAGLACSNIDQTSICTACRSDLFFSHRYEADETRGINTGRQLSFIMKPELLRKKR